MAAKSRNPARKPAAKKPTRRAAKKKQPVASAAPERPPLAVIIGQAIEGNDVIVSRALDMLDVIDMALSSSEAWPKGTEDEVYAVRGTLAQIGRMLKPLSLRV